MKSLLEKRWSWVVCGLLLALVFVSCQPEDSADVNQDRIYTHYEVFYNSNDDKTHAVARFRFGNPTGTLLELKDSAQVTFNGQVMPYSLIYSGHHLEFAGKVNGGNFVYTNNEAEVFSNTVDPYDEIAFPSGIDTIKKTEAYTLNWVGNSLVADEFVGVFIGTWQWGDDALFVQDGDGASNIVLGVNELAGAAVGQATMYMDRWTSKLAGEAPSAGGVVVGKHRAQNITVQVVN